MKPAKILPAILVSLAVLLPASASQGAQAQPTSPLKAQTWVRTGGPPGGLGYDIRMRPDDPEVMFVTDAWAGVHRSLDGGATWLPANEGIEGRTGPSNDAIPVFSLTIDPNNPDVLWAGLQSIGQVYRSTDGGETWELRSHGIRSQQGLSIRGLSIEPGNSQVVYASGEVSSWLWAGRELPGRFFDRAKGVVYKTADGGLNWGVIWEGDSLARYLLIDPHDVQTLYLSTGIFDREAANSNPGAKIPGGVGILKSSDGGATWFPINQGLENLYVGSLFMHPDNPQILLAGASNNAYDRGSGIYLTTDGGTQWRYVGGARITSVEFSLSDARIAYAGGEESHLYRSQDGGHTWIQLPKDGQGWGPAGIRPGFPIDFQVDPRDPLRLFANNYGGGNYLSEDGGMTWESASNGYTGANVASLSVDRSNPARIWTAGPFGSLDGGQSWEGFNPGRVPGIWQVSVNPGDPQRMLMSTNEGVVYASRDGGENWRIAADLSPQLVSRAEAGELDLFQGLWTIAFAPSDPERVYGGFAPSNCVGLGEAGGCRLEVLVSLLASDDGGESWRAIESTPFNGSPVVSILVEAASAERAWVATATEGLFLTSDGGLTWRALSSWPPGTVVLTVAGDPVGTQTLLAGTAGEGLMHSLDGGVTWRRQAAGIDPNETIEAIVVDPTQPSVVYAGSKASGVYVSEDGGATWQRLNQGLRTHSVRSLAIASDGQTLYAGTRGEGVFRLSTLSQEQFMALSPPQATASLPALPPGAQPEPLATATPTAPPGEQTAATTPQPSGGENGCTLWGMLPLLAAVLARRNRSRSKASGPPSPP